MRNFKRDYDLIIFDVDGTILDRNNQLLFDAPAIFGELRAQGIGVCCASNDGGAACLNTWPNSKSAWQWPTLADTLTKYDSLQRRIWVKIYLSLAYQKEGSGWAFPALPWGDARLDPNRRKPNCGMLTQAMSDFAGINDFAGAPDRCLMVGDGDEDKGAAANAGCHFMHIDEFRKETA